MEGQNKTESIHPADQPIKGARSQKTGGIKGDVPKYWSNHSLLFVARFSTHVVFTAQRYASALYAMALCLSVCLSVCSSQVGVLSKW